MKKEELFSLFGGFVPGEKKEGNLSKGVLKQLFGVFGIQERVKIDVGQLSSEEIVELCEKEHKRLQSRVKKSYQEKLTQAKVKNLFSPEVINAEVYLDKYGFLNRSQLKQLRKTEEE